MRTSIACILLLVLLCLVGCNSSSGTREAVNAPSQSLVSNTAGQPPILPDAQMTPGDTLDVTKDDICVSGYTQKVRNVPSSVKKEVYQEYGIASHQPGDYEIDHLISLELGGSNSKKNLWPQSYKTQPWNAHVKDQLENKLHDDICTNKVDLKTAQQEIASDWIAAYKREFNTQTPLSSYRGRERSSEARTQSAASVQTNDVAPSNGQVWVNLSSGKYWQPGTRYYGNTKRGQYMSEAQAQAQGYTPAGGQQGHQNDQ